MHESTLKTTTFSTKNLVLIGLVTAVTCILAPLSIPMPFSPIPISFTNLVIYFSIYLLGGKLATVSYIIYLLIGLVGLPVFSGFSGGIGKLLGPTGGYLVGFILVTLIAGWFADTFPKNKFLIMAGLLLATIVAYTLAAFWLSVQLQISFVQGIITGVLPYLPGDLVKMVIAVVLGPVLRGRVQRV